RWPDCRSLDRTISERLFAACANHHSQPVAKHGRRRLPQVLSFHWRERGNGTLAKTSSKIKTSRSALNLWVCLVPSDRCGEAQTLKIGATDERDPLLARGENISFEMPY